MARKLEIDLKDPIMQAGAIAKSIVEDSKSEFNDVSKKYIDDSMIDNLIAVAMQTSIDSSPLVIKQKIRGIIKEAIKKSI
jgi:hypothetical protein